MPNSTNEQLNWVPLNNVTLLKTGIVSGRVDTKHPNLGLHHISLNNEALACKLLRVYRSDRLGSAADWPLPLSEAYVRANDLIASYQASEDWPFFPQLYWQANSLHDVTDVLASISMLVSVQTHLLDSVPQIAISSQLMFDESYFLSTRSPASSAVRIHASQKQPSIHEDCCIVSRLHDLPLSYVEIMPAGDYQAVKLPGENSEAVTEWRLFADFLEKGVIRRARIHAAIVPRDRDLEVAAACCRVIDRLALPLTA